MLVNKIKYGGSNMAGFFDKVKDGLNKGVATAGAHSKAMMEKSKINAVISNQ